ncbi:MAG TPA: glycogen-binding domain-containing protein [Gemmatimonadales bacterium]|nr:glycogen-binding domain-containing protein [Gemmatimonadales bacterium]
MRLPLYLILCTATAGALSAQTDLSVGVGANTVRYSGGSSTSGSLSPAFRFTGPSTYLDMGGIIGTLENNRWSSVGRATLWLASPPLFGAVRASAEGNTSGTTYTDGPWTVAAHGLGEVFWSGPRGGIGLAAGASSGWIKDQSSVTAFHGRARAWYQLGRSSWSLSAEPTHFLGAWFTDVTAAASLDRGPVSLSAWGSARLSGTYPNRAAGGGAIAWYVLPRLALELGGGSYLPDPYQGLIGAKYLSAGVRLHSARRIPPVTTVVRDSPMVPLRQGDSVLVHFRMPGARTLALAGDWDGWTQHPLTDQGNSTWTGTLRLAPGLYHFVLLVDGTDWVVPAGVTRVPDGMGGFAALLTVTEP